MMPLAKNLVKNTTLFTLVIILFFFLFDIGNVDALRQGTEGFYLLVSNEMYESSSFLTPLYLGEPHWSKPPLHFWMAYASYFLTGGASLFAARAIVAILSIGLLIGISNWTKRYFSVPLATTLVCFAGTLGLIKYSRIYMMEIPLSLLSCLASLLFFDYIQSSETKKLTLASIVLALASLVKGPVAIVMCIGGVGLFAAISWIQRGRFFFKQIFMWGFFSVALSSIWYIISYLNHGQEFLEYFFLRENLGKFTAKSYPISSVINGLLIYGAPVTLFILALFDKNVWKRTFRHPVNLYLFCHFIFIFILWMIPNQRSHHYAMPALPFFLLFMLVNLNHYDAYKLKRDWRIFIPSWIEISFLLILFLISLLGLTFPEVSLKPFNLFRVLLTTIFLSTSIYLLFRRQNLYQIFLSGLVAFGTIWVLFAPTFYLPTVPEKIVKRVKGEHLAVQFRKPYFIEEAVGQEIQILDYNKLVQTASEFSGDYILIHERTFEKKDLGRYLKIVERWPIWRRGNEGPEIFRAVKEHDLGQLKAQLLLTAPRGDASRTDEAGD